MPGDRWSRAARAAAVAVVLLTAGCGAAPTRAAAPLPSAASPGPVVRSTPEPAVTASATAPARWVPTPRTTWQWQLTGRVDTSVPAAVYDVDLFDTPASTVAALHAKGRRVICYVNVGASESWRPDFASFPKAVLGRSNGWAGERWLDVRRLDVLLPIMARRLDLCRSKGFDAVEPDNVDGYANASGFPLTAAHQLAYNRAIARLAHARGLSVGLKNDLDQVVALEPSFDFAVNEECFAYRECAALTPFVKAGKAVFHVEYERQPSAFCPTTTRLGLSSLRKRYDLDAWRLTC